MICNNCGQTVPDGIKSCPHCGTTYIYTSAPVNPVAERLCAVFSDKLFLTASVLSAVKGNVKQRRKVVNYRLNHIADVARL